MKTWFEFHSKMSQDRLMVGMLHTLDGFILRAFDGRAGFVPVKNPILKDER